MEKGAIPMDPNTVPARRLVIVSNRLPFTVTEAEGKLDFKASSGGLVTGLSTCLQRAQGSDDAEPNYVWVGWPGISLDDPDQQDELRRQAAAEFHAHPVFVDEAEMDRFYHGFCNETIWPLFHYFPTYTTFEESGWQTYQHVNRLFCDAVLEVLQPGDMLWIHDYHLMLLPQLIRAEMPDVPIGFFLHIPFPAYEIFRLLPHAWRAGILEGLLGADLLGFHTYEYTQYFARAVLRVLGQESNLGRIPVDGRSVQLDTFPMGIDYATFHDAPATPEVQEELRGLREQFADVQVILSIDRLDYSKGIINR